MPVADESPDGGTPVDVRATGGRDATLGGQAGAGGQGGAAPSDGRPSDAAADAGRLDAPGMDGFAGDVIRPDAAAADGTGGDAAGPDARAADVGAAPYPSPVFEQTRLHEIALTLAAADWTALRSTVFAERPATYKADVTIDGQTVKQIGLRSRGWGSRNANKPGLKLDFNQYVPTQELHGYKDMVLDNMTQDRSMMKERLAFLVFEAMGIPAPHSAFARLTVNGQYWGLYAVVESVSKPFLKARLGNESGTLYDFDCRVPGDCYNLEWKGDAVGGYVPVRFDPQTNEQMPNAELLVAFIKAANMAPTATFLEEISKHLEVTQFLTYLAVENAIVDRDGWVGDWRINNVYLYQHGVTKKFLMLPWDKDYAFRGATHATTYNIDRNVLTRRLLAVASQKKIYEDAVRKAVKEFMNARWLTPKMEALYRQIREAALADTRKPYSNTDFEAAVTALRSVIERREANVYMQIGM